MFKLAEHIHTHAQQYSPLRLKMAMDGENMGRRESMDPSIRGQSSCLYTFFHKIYLISAIRLHNCRSYYRCIHKLDRGCPVTRQVQRTEENDSIFAITYMGLHTCMEDDHTAVDKQSLALDSKMNNKDNDRKELAAPPSVMEQDCEEEMISNESTARSCSSSEISSMFSGLAPLSAEDGASSANSSFGTGIDELIAWMSAN